jgi:hypothetical protein
MAEDEDTTLVDRWKAKVNNHPVLSIFVGIGIIVTALATFTDSVSKIPDSISKLLHFEKLEMTLAHEPGQKARIEQYAMTGAVTSLWEAVITNTGDRTVSVLGLTVRARRLAGFDQAGNPVIDAEGGFEYSGLFGNLLGRVFDAKGDPVAFPLALESERSVRLSIELKVLLDPKAFELLTKTYPTGEVPSLQQANKLMATSLGTDLFGQKAEPIRVGDDVFGVSVDQSRREPRLTVTFRTARTIWLAVRLGGIITAEFS